jgi:hypothetical protein
MDTFSHAVWGYVSLGGTGLKPAPTRRMLAAGALAGAAPDLLWFVPLKISQALDRGWAGVVEGRDPGIWRAEGPPLPQDLVDSYFSFYVWTHSLVVLAIAAALLWALLPRARRALWLAVPYGLHILMDIPTHERFLTRPFHPLSDWSFTGLSWADPRIFWPHLVVLCAAIVWTWRTRSKARREGWYSGANADSHRSQA